MTHRSDITGLRPDVTGVFVSLRCSGCATAFEAYQPTVAGLAFGQHACPRCGAVSEVAPEDFAAALDRFLPEERWEELVRLTGEATRVAESWHQMPELRSILRHRDVELGPATERQIVALIAAGLNAAARREGPA